MKLSPRETQVDKLATSGLTNAEIAAWLEIAEKTVMLHKRKIRMVKGWIEERAAGREGGRTTSGIEPAPPGQIDT